MTIHWRISCQDRVASTQDFIKSEAENGAAEGLVIWAREQTQGRGRYGRTWSAAEGNLYASFLLRPSWPAEKIGQLSLLIGLTIRDVAAHYIGSPMPVKLKWPNDILLGNRKCAGVLIEAGTNLQSLIIGFGVNLASAPLETAAAINDFSSNPVDPESFLKHTLDSFSYNYEKWQEQGFAPVRQNWLMHGPAKGDKLLIKYEAGDDTGIFETIDEDGHLVFIKSDGKTKKVTAGDVYNLDRREIVI